MSSFYASLSKYFADAAFLKQIREIGFLVEFESLLSSLGELIVIRMNTRVLWLNCIDRGMTYSLPCAVVFCIGDEIGMLEDMCVAVAELAAVQFQVRANISHHNFLHRSLLLLAYVISFHINLKCPGGFCSVAC